MTVMKKITPIATRSGGNVFADAGIPNATEHMLKARVVVVIMREIKRQQLNQKEAADMMGIKQPDVSRILRGDFAGFGLERLLRLVQKLGVMWISKFPAHETISTTKGASLCTRTKSGPRRKEHDPRTIHRDQRSGN
jgi:predicted XRE-type DNA-binding protein